MDHSTRTSGPAGTNGPRAQIRIPDGWEQTDAEGSLLAASAPEDGSGFRANVTVQRLSVPAPLDLAATTRQMLERYDVFVRWAVVASGAAVGRTDLWLVEVTFEDADAGTLLQTHAITGAAVGDAPAVFHACGTARPTDPSFDLLALRGCVQSLRLVETSDGLLAETRSQDSG